MRVVSPFFLHVWVVLALSIGAPCLSEVDTAPRPDSLSATTRSVVSLPLQFSVSPENRLYLYGQRIYTAQLTTAPGDSLRLNGVAILPQAERPLPWYEYQPPDEETLRRRYGGVPYVQSQVDTGASLAAAVAEFKRERGRVVNLLGKVYREARWGGDSVNDAGQKAFAQLGQFDRRGLVDWKRPPAVAANYIRVAWKGISADLTVTLDDAHGPIEKQPLSEHDKQIRATTLYEALAQPGPCCCFIGFGGFRLLCGEEIVARIEAGLDAVLATGELAEVPGLHEYTVREILEQHHAGTGLPN